MTLPELMKTCSGCGVEKGRGEFSRDRQKSDALCSRYKVCAAEDKRRWREAHRDEILGYQHRYRSENTEKICEARRIYYAANASAIISRTTRYHADNPEKQAAWSRRWACNNPDKRAVYDRNRRARLHLAAGYHSAADIAAQRTRQRGRCFWCGEKVGRHYHVDHVVPLSKGGSNGPENLVIACAPCNLRKGAKHPMEFAGVLC